LDDVGEVSRTSSCGFRDVRTIPQTRYYPGTGDLAHHPFETGLLPCKSGFFASWRTLVRFAWRGTSGSVSASTSVEVQPNVIQRRHSVTRRGTRGTDGQVPRGRHRPFVRDGFGQRPATRRVVDAWSEICFLARAVRTRARATPGGAQPAREG